MILSDKSLGKFNNFQRKIQIEDFHINLFKISKVLEGQLNKDTFIYSNFFLNKSQPKYSSI